MIKLPTEKSKKVSTYHSRMSAERADRLYLEIVKHISENKRYRDPSYTARQMAKELQTNNRYISTAIMVHTGQNYNQMVNSLRLRDACRLMSNPAYDQYTLEEIALMVGFSNRQSFHIAFNNHLGMTPHTFREEAKPKSRETATAKEKKAQKSKSKEADQTLR